jgi:hypothetical protein
MDGGIAMTMTWRRSDALGYAHEDLPESRDYRFKADGRTWTGKQTKTVCGHWFSACEDDPDHNANLWRWNRMDDRPTCPRCVELAPYAYPGMLLVVRGPLGLPQIVRVTGDEEWIAVVGLGGSSGRVVNSESKTVLHVCQNGDIFEDLGMVVKGGELVPVRRARR